MTKNDPRFTITRKVLLVQGTAFNWPPTLIISGIVTLPRENDLEMAIQKFGRFIVGYHQ